MTVFSLAECCILGNKRRNQEKRKQAQLLLWQWWLWWWSSVPEHPHVISFRHTLENVTSFQAWPGMRAENSPLIRENCHQSCLPLCIRAFLTHCMACTSMLDAHGVHVLVTHLHVSRRPLSSEKSLCLFSTFLQKHTLMYSIHVKTTQNNNKCYYLIIHIRKSTP